MKERKELNKLVVKSLERNGPVQAVALLKDVKNVAPFLVRGLCSAKSFSKVLCQFGNVRGVRVKKGEACVYFLK